MAARRRDDFDVNFDPVYEYRDPGGFRAQRFFKPHPRNNFLVPATAAAVPASTTTAPLVIGSILAVLAIAGLIIGLPLAIIFGVVLPNSSTDTTTTATTVPPVIPVSTSGPVVPPNTAAPQPEVLLVRCPNNIRQPTEARQNYTVVTWNPPTVLSHTVGQVQMFPSWEPNTRFTIGSVDVQYTVMDEANNRGGCSFEVTVEDKEPPSIVCPANVTVGTDPLSISAGVTWSPPTITDNSNMLSEPQMTDESGDHFHIGVHTVTIVIFDAAGNMNRCSFTITVEDREAPRVTCPADEIGYTNVAQTGTAVVTWDPPSVSENSLTPLQAVCTPPSGSSFSFGTTPVTCVATDNFDNMGNCTFNVMVRFNDTEPPVFSNCPSNMMMNADPDSDSTLITWTVPSATDNSQETPMVVGDMDPNQQYTIGVHEVVYMARDGNGNTALCTFTVEVLDNQDPTITCPASITEDTDSGKPYATVSLPAASATDNSMMRVTITTMPTGSPMLRIGSHVVVYTAEDTSGNTDSCNITVTVRDMEPPSFTQPPNFRVPNDPGQSYATVSLPLPSDVTDNSGEMVNITTSPSNDTQLGIGSHNVIYTLTDVNGNDVTFTLTVTVGDVDPPSFTPPENFTVPNDPGQPFATVSFPLPTNIMDNSGGVASITTMPANNSQLDIGQHTIHYTVTDAAGLYQTLPVIVTVIDDEDPMIECSEVVIQNTDPGLPNANVTLPDSIRRDNSRTPLTVTTDPSETSLVLSIGNHTVKYTVTDASGNDASCNLTIWIRDMEPPTFSEVQNFTVSPDQGSVFTNINLPFPDNLMDNSGEMVTVDTSPANNTQLRIGRHRVQYTVTDVFGNSRMFTVVVTVADENPPTFMRPSDFMVPTDSGQPFATVSLPLPTDVMDDSGQPVTITTSPANNSQLDIGMHVVVYDVADTSGNSVTFNITVTVEDADDPIIDCPDDVIQNTDSGLPDTEISLPNATASDNSNIPPTVTTDPSGFPQRLRFGNHTVTYTATDAAGNSASCNLTIVVIDNELPTLSEVPSFSAYTDDGSPTATLVLPTVNGMDNSGEPVTVTSSPANNSQLGIGTNLVTVIGMDSTGNSASFSINVTVIDQELPSLMCPENITQPTDMSVAYANVTFAPQVLSDNDGMTPSLSNDYAGGNIFDIGSTTVTLTARDSSGNENTCSFTVTVRDEEPPQLQCPSEVVVYSDNFLIPRMFSDVATWTVTITDNSGVPLMSNTTTHEPGSTFTNTTTVTYTAVDAYNNTNQCSFDVIITGFNNSNCTASGVDLNLTQLMGTNARYHLLSPGFDNGNPYPSDQDCVWRVMAPPGTHIRVNFMAFDTEFRKDTLTIGSGLDETLASTSIASYSGDPVTLQGTLHTKDRVFGDDIWLRFVSSDTFELEERGFWLRLDFISDPRSLYPSSYSFCLEFDGFPCLDGSCVNISQRCDSNQDCPSGEDEDDCPQMCSVALPTETVDFTDAGNGQGYTDITSVNYPGQYPWCTSQWDINSASVHSIRVVVMDLQIGPQDRLYIINRDTNVALTSDIVSPISVHLTNGPNFAVVFESKGGSGRGFWLRVWRYITSTTNYLDYPAFYETALHSLTCADGGVLDDENRCDGSTQCPRFGDDEDLCMGSYDCGNLTISLSGEGDTYYLTSVNYPADYYSSVDCRYTVTTNTAKILVSFLDVEIAAGDSLQIGNGHTFGAATIVSVTGFFLPADIESTSNTLWIDFQSSESRNSRGFWIVLVARN